MRYYFAARTAAGELVSGSLESPDAATAVRLLRARMLFVSALQRSGTAGGLLGELAFARPVPAHVLAGFFRAFATLMRAGIPLARALPICADGCDHKRMAAAIRSLKASIEAGTSLSEAMRSQPLEFSPLIVGTIRAGEQGAALEDVLDRIAAAAERDVAVRRKIVSALIYPVIVAGATVAVLTLLLYTTLPAFANMYAQLRVTVPPMLQALLALGNILRSPVVIAGIMVLTAFVVAALLSAGRTPQGVAAAERIRFAIPVFGAFAKKAVMARVARLLGMLLGCGVNLHSAVPMVARAINSPQFHASLAALQESLAEGSAIALPLERTGLYAPLFLQLVRVGEETGRVAEMLARVAQYYELEIENATQQLGSLLEPVLILVLGATVGGVAAAIFIPLYSLIGSMR